MPAPSTPAPTPCRPTFAKTDSLNLQTFCQKLETYLLVDSDYADDSLVIALNASFGGGKTTFLEMWKTDLLERRESTTAPACVPFTAPMPVMLNAWESDYCGDPLVAILAGLDQVVQHWTGNDKPAQRKISKLREAITDASWCAAGLANSFTSSLTGINAKEALELKDEKKAERNPPPPNFIALFNQRQQALHKLKASLAETFAGASTKVIVFVDELDRCRPDYSVSYLETIKHVFNVKGMIFLLAVDLHHLEVSTKSLFGTDLNFPEYFRKFTHRIFHLPKPEQAPMQQLLESYITQFVAITGKRNSIFNNHPSTISYCAELAKGFQMNPRQLKEAFRTFGHVMSTQDDTKVGQVSLPWMMATILLCYLRTAKQELYRNIYQGNAVHEELCTPLRQHMGQEDAKYWIQLYLTGISPDCIPSGIVNSYLQKMGYLSLGEEAKSFLSSVNRDWKNARNPIENICRKIENAECLV